MVDQAEIHRKAASGEVEERRDAVSLLRDNFADLPDKEQAWEDLHRLTGDKYSGVRRGATYSLGTVFPYVPDKEQAQKDLHQRTSKDEDDDDVRWFAARALGSVFQHIPDKKQAWEDLIWLTKDKDKYVQLGAADALGSAFQHALDKEEAWNDLHRLTGSEDVYVRLGAADALGSAFQHVPDKKQAWEDLIQLTEYKDRYVRASANHSMGRASIFKATEAEGSDDFKSELKNAIQFFERSLKEGTDFNPSRFCLPFYRSFYSLTFEKAGAEDEVQKCLAEAKSASEGSKNKEILLEAVANLANALSEAQKVTNFNAIKSELNACRLSFNRAADLIGDAAEGAPGTARVLRRGLPIIDNRVREIIREIQEKAEAVRRETRGTGTPYEPLGIEVNKWAGELSDRDDLQNERIASRIANILGEFCNLLPEDKRGYPCKIVEELREESEPESKLIDIATALSYLEPCIESQLQNAAKPTTNKTISDEQPSQKTGHSTTVIAEAGSNVTVTQTETEGGDVTVTHNAKAIEESQPDKHRIDHRKKIAIEIIAAFAGSVLVRIFSNRYLENLTPTASTVIAFIAFIILLIIILTQNRDRSS